MKAVGNRAVDITAVRAMLNQNLNICDVCHCKKLELKEHNRIGIATTMHLSCELCWKEDLIDEYLTSKLTKELHGSTDIVKKKQIQQRL